MSKKYISKINKDSLDIYIRDAEAARTEGHYPSLQAGSADNLVSIGTISDTFLERPTGGESTEVDNNRNLYKEKASPAVVEKIEGNGLAWNQLVKNGNFVGITNWSEFGVTATPSDNIVSVYAAENGDNRLQQSVSMVVGHKYYFSCWTKGATANSAVLYLFYGTGSDYTSRKQDDPSVWEHKAVIFTRNEGVYQQIRLQNEVGGTTNQYKNVMLYDLTLLGIDNLTTTAEVEAWLATHIGTKPYYPYNAGTLLPAKLQGFKTTGKSANLLNPDTRKARLFAYTYGDANTSNVFTLKNLPSGASVSFTPDATGVALTIATSGGDITIDNDGHFSIANYGSGELAISGNDDLSNTYVVATYDGALDNTFDAWDGKEYAFDTSKVYGKLNGAGDYVQIFPNGMRGAGSVHDLIDLQSMTADVNVGSVDLGGTSTQWIDVTSDSRGFMSPVIKSTAKIGGALGIVCAKYVCIYTKYDSNIRNAADKTLCYNDGVYIYAKDSSYIDVASFKTAMSGVMLFYELATPLVYTDCVYHDNGVEIPLSELPIVVNNYGYEQVELDNTASAFSTSKEYAIGDYVTYNDVQYRFTAQKTTGAWDSTKVTADASPLSCAPNTSIQYGLDAAELVSSMPNIYATRKALAEGLMSKVDNNEDEFFRGTAAKANVLVGKEKEDTATYTLRSAGGKTNNVDNDIESGLATLKSIEGNGLAWNQMYHPYRNRSDKNGLTIISEAGSMKATITGTSEAAGNGPAFCFTEMSVPNGHKVFIKFFGELPEGDFVFDQYNVNGRQDVRNGIYTVNAGYVIPQLKIANAGVVYNQEVYLNIIDLSLIFGLDVANTITDVETAERMLAALVPQKPYYQYNPGELYGVKKLHLVSYGQNLLNPANGQARLVPYQWSENSVNDSDKYGIAFRNGATAATNGVTFTPDATGVEMVVGTDIDIDTNGIFAIPSAGTMQVTMASGSSASDVYVWAVWDGKKNGIENFVPFSQDALEIKVSEVYGKLNGAGEYVKVFADDVMRGAGDAHDVIDLQSMTADVNMGSANLGNLDYAQDSGTTRYYGLLLGGKNAYYRGTGAKNNSNCIISTPKYRKGSGYDINDQTNNTYSCGNDSSISVGSGKSRRVYIIDSSAADAAALKASLASANVFLWYELATPSHYTDLKLSSDSGQTFRELPKSFAVDNWGIEEQLPNDATIPTGKDFTGVAAQVTTVYQQNVEESIESLPMEYASLVDFQKKADKAAPYTEGNVAILSKQGNYADSGVAMQDVIVGDKIIASVDNTSGNPSVSASYNETTRNLTLAFSGLKGVNGLSSILVIRYASSGTPSSANIHTTPQVGDKYIGIAVLANQSDTPVFTWTKFVGDDGIGIAVKPNKNACSVIGDAYIDQDSSSATYGCIMILTDPTTTPMLFENGGQIKGPKGDRGYPGATGADGSTSSQAYRVGIYADLSFRSNYFYYVFGQEADVRIIYTWDESRQCEMANIHMTALLQTGDLAWAEVLRDGNANPAQNSIVGHVLGSIVGSTEPIYLPGGGQDPMWYGTLQILHTDAFDPIEYPYDVETKMILDIHGSIVAEGVFAKEAMPAFFHTGQITLNAEFL